MGATNRDARTPAAVLAPRCSAGVSPASVLPQKALSMAPARKPARRRRYPSCCFPENVVAPVRKVKEFGVAEKLSELTEASSRDDEYLGWAMTAIAARILEAKGAYRCPRDEGGYTYLLYVDLAFADQAKRVQDKAKIDCSRHGRGYATYISEHLLAQPAQDWFSNTPAEEDPWPDAWCASCEILFQEQGEWSRANEKKANIKLLCHCCYEKLRAKGSLRNSVE
jgi:hypothetical protein